MNRVTAGAVADPNTRESTAEQKAFVNFLRFGAKDLPTNERKALTMGSNTDGGYLATFQFESEVIKNVVQYWPVRQAARVSAMSAAEILLPRRTGRPTGFWVGETESRSETQSVYGNWTIPANEMACYVDVSVKLIEDAAVDIVAEISSDLAEEFGRLEGEAFVTGDSIKKPEGIMQSPDVPQVASGSGTAIGADALIDMFYSLAPFYRAQSTWMLNGTSIAAVRKLKDTYGQYLWQPSLGAGQPDTLLGRPVIEAIDMPDIAANSYPIVLGAFTQGYRVYDRSGSMTLLRDPYSLATSGMIRFHARRRVAGKVVKGEAFRKMKVAVGV